VKSEDGGSTRTTATGAVITCVVIAWAIPAVIGSRGAQFTAWGLGVDMFIMFPLFLVLLHVTPRRALKAKALVYVLAFRIAPVGWTAAMTAVRTRSWIWTAAAAVVAYLVFDLLNFSWSSGAEASRLTGHSCGARPCPRETSRRAGIFRSSSRLVGRGSRLLLARSAPLRGHARQPDPTSFHRSWILLRHTG
jgi:hypothetical protein